MKSLFVIGDIYGYKDRLEALLKHWNPDKQKLILLGNLMGKGEDSAGVVRLVKKLSIEYGALSLKGDREELFLSWIGKPEVNPASYYSKSGREALNSFFKDVEPKRVITEKLTPDRIAEHIMKNNFEELSYLWGLPDFIEEGNYLCVPAGVRLDVSNWKVTSPVQFRIGHESFIDGKNRTGKIILFGNLPPRLLHRTESLDVWTSPCKTKIGLNGLAEKNGLCHAVYINSENKHTFYQA